MAKFMGIKVVESNSVEDLEHKVFLAKAELAFHKLEQPYDWYLAEELMNTQGITFDSEQALFDSQLKAILVQAGY